MSLSRGLHDNHNLISHLGRRRCVPIVSGSVRGADFMYIPLHWLGYTILTGHEKYKWMNNRVIVGRATRTKGMMHTFWKMHNSLS